MNKSTLILFIVGLLIVPQICKAQSPDWNTAGNTILPGDWLGTFNPLALEIKTGNSERMRITATGDVGINTTTPLSLLHGANGDLLFSCTNLPAGVPPTQQITNQSIQL